MPISRRCPHSLVMLAKLIRWYWPLWGHCSKTSVVLYIWRHFSHFLSLFCLLHFYSTLSVIHTNEGGRSFIIIFFLHIRWQCQVSLMYVHEKSVGRIKSNGVPWNLKTALKVWDLSKKPPRWTTKTEHGVGSLLTRWKNQTITSDWDLMTQNYSVNV